MSDADRRVPIDKPVLSKNDRLAAENRERFAELGALTVNLISSPGSGKTTLLEALGREFGDDMAVIVGDLQTRRDADRIEAAGVRAVQIETGGSCHLDAERVGVAFDQLGLAPGSVRLLVIENVGNLVCPSSYDLGEHFKAALLSVTEGDDKVLKYPSIFRRVGALVISKIDLLPHMDFDPDRAERECAGLNDAFETFRVSAKTGEGMEALCRFLRERQSALRA